jgi:antitoxin Phd
MKVYTYSEARQRLAAVLEQARRDGRVCIRKRDGQTFILQPYRLQASPLDVDGVDLGLTSSEIVEFVREARERCQ